MSGLLKMAALGGVERSTTGIAQKIRQDAEDAFKARLLEDQQDHARDMQDDSQAHSEQMQSKSQAHSASMQEDSQEHGLLMQQNSQAHQSKENENSRSFKKSESEKDRTTQLLRSTNNTSKTQSDYYKTLLKNKNAELEFLMKTNDLGEPNGTPEDIKRVRTEISRLEADYGSLAGVPVYAGSGGGDTPQSRDEILAKFMSVKGLEDTEENRAKASKALANHPKYGSMFKSEGDTGLLQSASSKSGPGEPTEIQKAQKEYSDRIAREKSEREGPLLIARYQLRQMLNSLQQGKQLSPEDQENVDRYINIMRENLSYSDNSKDSALLENLSQYLDQ